MLPSSFLLLRGLSPAHASFKNAWPPLLLPVHSVQHAYSNVVVCMLSVA